MAVKREHYSRSQGRAIEDRLAGLPGRDALFDRIASWRADVVLAAQNSPLHLMMFTLNSFDSIALAYGNSAGEIALESMVSRISDYVDKEFDGLWMLARIEKNSLVLAANELCGPERWQLIAEQVFDRISAPIAVPSGILRITTYISLIRAITNESVQSMLFRLTSALSGVNKEHSGDRLVWADGEIAPLGRSTKQLEADLLQGIDRGEIEVLFQPQFDLKTDQLTGAEALARWNHPLLGRIGAAALFAIAERAECIGPLSQHIARKALFSAKSWDWDLSLSINVTPEDLAFGGYTRQMLDLVRESGFPPRRLTLEVTEQTLIGDVTLAAQTMAEFSAQGIRIALDDFGAGFCNFRYLKVLPIHYLKLDRSMVDDITTDRRDLAVLRAIVAMATALGLEVIAEGIEDTEQRNIVAQEGCTYYQGFIRAQPMSEAMFNKLARAELT